MTCPCGEKFQSQLGLENHKKFCIIAQKQLPLFATPPQKSGKESKKRPAKEKRR